MFKYITACALMFSVPAMADPVAPPDFGITTVTVETIEKSLDSAHRIIIHKDAIDMDIIVAGCPVPVANTDYYLIAVPKVGMFLTSKTELDHQLIVDKGDFGEATHHIIDANLMCVVVAAKKIEKL